MKDVVKSYEEAKEKYAAIGVDTDAALKQLQDVKISMHCWQGDDVLGFLNPEGELTGESWQREIIPVLLIRQPNCGKI